MVERIIRWLLFSVVISLIPFIFSYFKSILRGNIINLTILIERGELLLISTTIMAAAFGQYITSKLTIGLPEILLSGSSIFFIILSSLLYAEISTASSNGEQLEHNMVYTLSIVFFGVSLLISGSCIAFSKVESNEIQKKKN